MPDMDYIMAIKAKKAAVPPPAPAEIPAALSSEHVANTEGTPSEHVANTKKRFKKYAPTELRTFSIRLLPRDIVALTKHFTLRGITVSAGLRTVVREYMNREGLL
jgi:hypothetical protein